MEISFWCLKLSKISARFACDQIFKLCYFQISYLFASIDLVLEITFKEMLKTLMQKCLENIRFIGKMSGKFWHFSKKVWKKIVFETKSLEFSIWQICGNPLSFKSLFLVIKSKKLWRKFESQNNIFFADFTNSGVIQENRELFWH